MSKVKSSKAGKKNAGKVSSKGGVKAAKKGSKVSGPKPGTERSWGVKAGRLNVPCETKINSATDGKMAGCFGRVTISGHPLAQVLRAFGASGMSNGEVRRVMDRLGLQAVTKSTIATQVYRGGAGIEGYSIAPLSRAELAAFKAMGAE